MNKQGLILIGAGGHCRSAIDVIESSALFSIKGILGLPVETGQPILNYSITGTDADIEQLNEQGLAFAITIGFAKSAEPRVRMFDFLSSMNAVMPLIAAGSSVVASTAIPGIGTMLFHRSVINAGAVIGKNNIINTGAIIEHDCMIGDHNHISTGAIVNGGCRIGHRCFIGSGTIIKEGISIADDVIVGAGSVITRNITESGIYYGIPARKKN